MTLTDYYNLIRDDAGKILKRERKQYGYSRRRLAQLAYTDPETIEYIEEGYVCMMTPNILKNIVLTLNLEYDEFLIRKLSADEIGYFQEMAYFK